MFKRKTNTTFAGLFLIGALASSTALAEIAIITNPGNDTASLTASEAKALFLKKTTIFPNGSPATIGDQSEDSAIHAEFASKVLKKTTQQLSSYWSKRVFSGKAMPPKVVGDDKSVKAWVAKTPDSIGYVDAGVVDDSVKVLLRVP